MRTLRAGMSGAAAAAGAGTEMAGGRARDALHEARGEVMQEIEETVAELQVDAAMAEVGLLGGLIGSRAGLR